MKVAFISALILCCALVSTNAQVIRASKVLLIPLDDRPPCLQFPVKMGMIGNVEISTPPRNLLGRFTRFGQPDSIILWLKQQNLKKFDAAIISMDMLAYGGLVASRVFETPIENALQHFEIITEIRQQSPHIKIYGSSVIMRIAPTADGKNEGYREKLARWAEDSPYPEKKEIVEALAQEIPKEALANYKKARERNLQVNLLAISLVEKKILDYLILSQDDAKPKGIHIKERETLMAKVESLNIMNQVAIQPGADEVSMLLLARSMSDKYNYHPKIKAVYSSEKVANQVMPFEDRPLGKTVSFHLKAVGAHEVFDTAQANIVFYIFGSRFENHRAHSFATEIINFIKNNPEKGLIVADIDPKGETQGGDTIFNEILKNAHVFSKAYGYASWNTAGNTIGTALPQSILYGISREILKTKPNKNIKKRMNNAQIWFMLHRLFDDYAYHSVVRPIALAKIAEHKWNPFRLTDEQTRVIEADCSEILKPVALKLVHNFAYTEGVYELSKFTFLLPWNRTFEAEIDFNYISKSAKKSTK